MIIQNLLISFPLNVYCVLNILSVTVNILSYDILITHGYIGLTIWCEHVEHVEDAICEARDQCILIFDGWQTSSPFISPSYQFSILGT